MTNEKPTTGLPEPTVFPSAFIFERQRLIRAAWLENRSLKAMAREIAVRILPGITRVATPWTLHAFVANPDSDQPLTRRAAGEETA